MSNPGEMFRGLMTPDQLEALTKAREILQEDALPDQDQGPFQLQKLNERHRQAAALLAQGVPRATVAAIVKYTPEYITWLSRQPIFANYIREMMSASRLRLEALFEKSVDVIAENLGAGGELSLKAARLQLEATGRIGRDRRSDDGDGEAADRLNALADRLVQLLKSKREETIDGEIIEVGEPEPSGDVSPDGAV